MNKLLFIFCIIVFLFKTQTVFSSNLIYDVNNVEVSGKISKNSDKKKLIQSAFKKAFVTFVNKTLLKNDALNFYKTKINVIEDLVFAYQIVKDSKNDANERTLIVNIKFDPKKISNLFSKKKYTLVHFDADLYSSTLYCLTMLHNHFDSYVAIFDEFPMHECSALHDYASSYNVDIKSGEDFWPQTLKFLHGSTIRMGNYDLLSQMPGYYSEPVRDELQSIGRNDAVEKWQEHFDFIGYPNFKLEIAIENPSYVESLSTFNTPLNFAVNIKDSITEKELLYYDSENQIESYNNTSYPLLVNLNLELFDYENFDNNKEDYNENEILAAIAGGEDAAINYLNNVIDIPTYASEPDKCYYKYHVIQWGDEKQLLTDEQINNSYFFNFYEIQPEHYKNTTLVDAHCLEFESFAIPGFQDMGYDS